ncbi:MAG TPA: GtrA family protein [Caulobacteraceae bacterium]|nr:GtrA family protein [Caulobacteraceae bacterium]
MTVVRRLASAVLPILAGTVMIMAMVLINGRPSVFTDTDDYFVEGRTFVLGFAYATGIAKPPPAPTDPDAIADAQQLAADIHMSHTEIGARSPYFGAFLYVTQKIGTIWFTTLVQAAMGAWLIWLLWRAACPRAPPWTAYMVEAVSAFGSTLPFFASFMMPDIFAGYAAIAATLLLVFWDRLAKPERVVLAALLAFSMCVHTSHLLNTVGATLIAIACFIMLRAPRERASAATFTVIGAVLAVVAANGGYAAYVQAKSGDELHRPPFLAMRVIADGPGRDYLRAECGKNGVAWTLCQFKNRPNVDSQDMLWSDDRAKGIFNVTTYDNRLKMEQEETRFVLAAVAYEPLEQAWASLKNWGDQLAMVYLDDPLRNPHYYLTNAYWSTTNLPWLINRAADCGRDHWGCGARLTMDGSLWLHSILFIAGCAMVAWRLSEKDMRTAFGSLSLRFDDERGRLATTMILLAGTILINAFVCGALSGPFARYQARIAWLADLGAGLCIASMIPAEATLASIVRRLRAHPLALAFEKRFDPAFIRFGLVGTAGFLVHATVLHLAVDVVGLNPYLGWLCGFAVAVVTTLSLNRAFTFRQPSHHGPWRQAAIYLLVQGAGAATNFCAYAATLAILPVLHQALFVPLAVGSITGLCLTFLGSKHLAFRPAKAGELEISG